MGLGADTPLRPHEMDAQHIVGATIYGPEDQSIGTVSHIRGAGYDAQVIVDVRAFSKDTHKQVALSIRRMVFRRSQDGTIYATTAITPAQVNDRPEYHGE